MVIKNGQRISSFRWTGAITITCCDVPPGLPGARQHRSIAALNSTDNRIYFCMDDTYVRQFIIDKFAYPLYSVVRVNRGDFRLRALHYRLRPVVTSGVFVPPKKVRTRVIYSHDECLRPRAFIYFQNEGEA